MPFVNFVLRFFLSLLAADARQPVLVPYRPPRGVGLPLDRTYSAFADYQHPGSTYDAW